jgi:tRNA modification GTPase
MSGGDVIVAVSTAWGEGAISIVRVSGDGALAMAEKFFRGARPLSCEAARRMALGNIATPDGVVDQVLAVRFERGSSYTGEECVEIHCHGGVAAARACMEIFRAAGARTAMPGEFTRRAFLNGRIDLAQAEAVSGVIRARSDAELKASSRTLQGELSSRLALLSRELTEIRAGIEARLDFPDEVTESESREVGGDISDVRDKMAALLERCRVGLVLKNGVSVAIIGRPNVGKSSLLNALAGEDRAIVTDIPGTTRDTLDVSLLHRGLYIRLVDTAGMRDLSGAQGEADLIERMGQARSLGAIKGADLCVLVVDSSTPIAGADLAVAEACRGRPALLAVNKSDLVSVIAESDAKVFGDFAAILRVSALTGKGVMALRDAIFEFALGDAAVSEGMLATERMVDSLTDAVRSMNDAISALELSHCLDVVGSLLAEAAERLSSILGGDATEELLDAIFSTFCVGK